MKMYQVEVVVADDEILVKQTNEKGGTQNIILSPEQAEAVSYAIMECMGEIQYATPSDGETSFREMYEKFVRGR